MFSDDSSRAGQAWLEMVAFFSRQNQLYNNYRHVDDNMALYQYQALLRERDLARHMPHYQQQQPVPPTPPSAGQHHPSSQSSPAQPAFPGSSHAKTPSSVSNMDMAQDGTPRGSREGGGAGSRPIESWLHQDSPIKREPSEARYVINTDEMSSHPSHAARTPYSSSDLPPSNESSIHQMDKSGLSSNRDSNADDDHDNGGCLNLSRSSSVTDDSHSAASTGLAHLEHYEPNCESDSLFFQFGKHAGPSHVVQRQSSYKCPVCDKTFLHNSSYNRHMKLHQGVFSHICAVCGRKFTRREHFVRHKCNRRPNKPSRVLSSGEEAASEHLAYPPSPQTLSHMGLQGDSPGSLGEDQSQSDIIPRSHPVPIGLHHGVPLNIEPSPSIQDDSVLELTKSRRKPSTPQRIDMSIADDESEGLDLTTDERRNSAPPSLVHGENNLQRLYERPPFSRMTSNSPTDRSPQEVQMSSPTTSAYDDHKAQHPETPTDYSSRPPLDYLPSHSRTKDIGSSQEDSYNTNCNQDGGDLEQQHSRESEMKYDNYCEPPRNDHHDERDGEGSPAVWPSASHPLGGELSRPSSPSYIENANQANEREMSCPLCEKKFLHLSSLHRHLKLHQGVFTHVCAVCGRRFTRKEHFIQHKCSRRPKDPNRQVDRHVPLEDSAQHVAFPPAIPYHVPGEDGNLHSSQQQDMGAPNNNNNNLDPGSNDMPRATAVSGEYLLFYLFNISTRAEQPHYLA